MFKFVSPHPHSISNQSIKITYNRLSEYMGVLICAFRRPKSSVPRPWGDSVVVYNILVSILHCYIVYVLWTTLPEIIHRIPHDDIRDLFENRRITIHTYYYPSHLVTSGFDFFGFLGELSLENVLWCLSYQQRRRPGKRVYTYTYTISIFEKICMYRVSQTYSTN